MELVGALQSLKECFSFRALSGALEQGYQMT